MSAAKCRGSSRWRPRASFAAVTARAFRARQLLARAKGRRSFLLERGPSRLQRRAASCGPPLFSERPLKLAVDDLHVVDVVAAGAKAVARPLERAVNGEFHLHVAARSCGGDDVAEVHEMLRMWGCASRSLARQSSERA